VSFISTIKIQSIFKGFKNMKKRITVSVFSLIFVFPPLQLSAKNFLSSLCCNSLLFESSEKKIKCPPFTVSMALEMIQDKYAKDLSNNIYDFFKKTPFKLNKKDWYLDLGNSHALQGNFPFVETSTQYATKVNKRWQCEYKVSFRKDNEDKEDEIYLYLKK
jgi:hypothetical protein